MSRPRTITYKHYQELFDFIVKYKQEHDGNSPDFRTMMEACNISSLSVMSYMLKWLEKGGRIRLPKRGKSKGIEVVGGEWTFSNPSG